MAKQTFTTGSVLTATQMNNLQANDYNWTVSQKTASYVLVAADAGTRIEMNSGSATTITVNTGLFSAGDTLFIQNIGAGATTVTAGTATVNKATAGSLTLAQYQGGTLYFVSASSAVFFADAGYTPPLTTKGDLFGYDSAAARIPIGSNNQVLTADSTQALGLKWATPASGGMTLLGGSAGNLASQSSVSINVTANTYIQLFAIVTAYSATATPIRMRFNSDSGTNYASFSQLGLSGGGGSSASGGAQAAQFTLTSNMTNSTADLWKGMVTISNNDNFNPVYSGFFSRWTASGDMAYTAGYWNSSSITSVQILTTSGTFSGGSFLLYGVK